MRRAALRHDDVARRSDDGDAVRVEQLPVAFPALAELELEAPLAVEDLDAMVVGVGHDDVVLRVDGDAARLGELPLHDSELPELAVVDHLLALDLRLGRVDVGGDELRGEIDDRIGAGREDVSVVQDVQPAVRPLLVWVDVGRAAEQVGGRPEVQTAVGRELLLGLLEEGVGLEDVAIRDPVSDAVGDSIGNAVGEGRGRQAAAGHDTVGHGVRHHAGHAVGHAVRDGAVAHGPRWRWSWRRHWRHHRRRR